MARLRSWVCYRDYKRPYTRYSKFSKYCYIRARPANRVSRFAMGKQEDFPCKVHLVSKQQMAVRDNAIESARMAAVRLMETIGKTGWFLQIRIFPHHIVRENPLAAGAGADRMSTGMAHNYGKPIGIAAQVRQGQQVISVHTTKDKTSTARAALLKASYKLPFTTSIMIETMKPVLRTKTALKAKAVA